MIKNTIYYLDKPGGHFNKASKDLRAPLNGEITVKTRRTSICQSDVVIYKYGLPRIKEWPAIILHETCCEVIDVGEGVVDYEVGDILGIGCDLPCGDLKCIYCGENGTGDWTSCPSTHATGHEFPGFAQTHAVLPNWFVRFGPIKKFPRDFDLDQVCQLEPLACCLEGMKRVNNCIENRVVVLIGAGSQSTYALQVAQAMKARKIIVVNRGKRRLDRILKDFGNETVVGLLWNQTVVERVFEECKPFNEPHFIMMNVPHRDGYELATKLLGYNTVLDAHAGVKGPEGKPEIIHQIDLNNDIHYKLQCYQATHGSSMYSINLAQSMLLKNQLPYLSKMTRKDEVFDKNHILEAIKRADDSDSLKVIIDWD